MSNRLLIPNTTQVPNVILDEVIPKLTSGPVRVLLAIIRLTYGFQKSSDRISHGSLAKKTGLSRRRVITGVKALGGIIKVSPGKWGLKTWEGANEYSLNLDILTGQLEGLCSAQTVTGDQNVTRDDKGIYEVTKTSHSQTKVLNQLREPPLASHSRGSVPDPTQVKAFGEFYEAYPRHVGKAEAERAWMKLNPNKELREKIMIGTRRYAEEMRDSEPKYIKHPGPWLNARRWEDEPAVTAKGQASQMKEFG